MSNVISITKAKYCNISLYQLILSYVKTAKRYRLGELKTEAERSDFKYLCGLVLKRCSNKDLILEANSYLKEL